jgi:hypothetical protein
VVRPEELGIKVDGVLELQNGFIAMINGREVRPGMKVGELHLIDIQFGVITIDVGDGTIVKARF